MARTLLKNERKKRVFSSDVLNLKHLMKRPFFFFHFSRASAPYQWRALKTLESNEKTEDNFVETRVENSNLCRKLTRWGSFFSLNSTNSLVVFMCRHNKRSASVGVVHQLMRATARARVRRIECTTENRRQRRQETRDRRYETQETVDSWQVTEDKRDTRQEIGDRR